MTKLIALVNNDPEGKFMYRSPEGVGIDGFLKPGVYVNLIDLSMNGQVNGHVANNESEIIANDVRLDKIIVRSGNNKDTILTMRDHDPSLNLSFQPSIHFVRKSSCLNYGNDGAIRLKFEEQEFGICILGMINLCDGTLRMQFVNIWKDEINIVGYSVDARYNE